MIGWVICSKRMGGGCPWLRKIPGEPRDSRQVQMFVCMKFIHSKLCSSLLIQVCTVFHNGPQGPLTLFARRKIVANTWSITPLCDTGFYLLSSQWFSHRSSSQNLSHLHQGKSSQWVLHEILELVLWYFSTEKKLGIRIQLLLKIIYKCSIIKVGNRLG